ncbi:MAG TPA: hypothetical protein VF794_38715 [Archangium sp.]|jgi:hypothetical protein|uniref:hypothetical protein n=1 Tax=Archangium sp. TaxID=1872627 RepID=UPI002EDB0675
MSLRINGSPSRPPVSVAERAVNAPSPAPAKVPEQVTTARPGDLFEVKTARVAAVGSNRVDEAKLMRDYLTGAIPPPADFEKVMGYKPVQVETKHGTRMQDPHGSASAPGGIGPDQDFDPMAKTHDYGYDLLRYYGRKGQPLGPDARKAADAQFRQDLFHHANDKKGLKNRWESRFWAQAYSVAVELNSKRQNYGVP